MLLLCCPATQKQEFVLRQVVAPISFHTLSCGQCFTAPPWQEIMGPCLSRDSKVADGLKLSASQRERRDSYATKPAEGEEIVETAYVARTDTVDAAYTNLKDLLEEQTEEEKNEERRRRNSTINDDIEEVVDPFSAQGKLEEYKKSLKAKGIGTRRRKSVNDSLMMVNVKAELENPAGEDVIKSEDNRKKGRGNENDAQGGKGTENALPLLAMGLTADITKHFSDEDLSPEFRNGGSLAGTTANSQGTDEFDF